MMGLIHLGLQPVWLCLRMSRLAEAQPAFDLLLAYAISAYRKSKRVVSSPLTHHHPVLLVALALCFGSSAASFISSDLELSCGASNVSMPLPQQWGPFELLPRRHCFRNHQARAFLAKDSELGQMESSPDGNKANRCSSTNVTLGGASFRQHKRTPSSAVLDNYPLSHLNF